jgi:hypothetical protein
LLGLLWERDQRVLYIPGLSVNRASDAYRGESKTDARDARVIADQARMRSDLGKLEPGEEGVAELRILLGRRRDLVLDQNRTITRLGEALLSLSPALERALDLNRRGSLTLLTRYQSPQRLRRARPQAHCCLPEVPRGQRIRQRRRQGSRCRQVSEHFPAGRAGRRPHRRRARRRDPDSQGPHRTRRRADQAAFLRSPGGRDSC